MGLTSWIKEKYYNHRLATADEAVANGDYCKAEQIYRDIKDEQSEAIVHLANLYFELGRRKDYLGIKKLRKIEELYREAGTDRKSEIFSILNALARNIEDKATKKANSGQYDSALTLLKAVETYRKTNQAYRDNVLRYTLYDLLSHVENKSTYSQDLKSVRDFLENHTNEAYRDIFYQHIEKFRTKGYLDKAYNLAYLFAKQERKSANYCLQITIDLYNKGNKDGLVKDVDVLTILEFAKPVIKERLSELKKFIPYGKIYAKKYAALSTDWRKTLDVFERNIKNGVDLKECYSDVISDTTSKFTSEEDKINLLKRASLYYSETFLMRWANTYVAYAVKKIAHINDDTKKLQEYGQTIAKLKESVSMDSLTNDILVSIWEPAAKINEKAENYTEAISLYKELADNKNYRKRALADLRKLICAAKIGTYTIHEDEIKRCQSVKGFSELVYRYALALLNKGMAVEANKLLLKYLPSEKLLIEYCNNLVIKQAEYKLTFLNEQIEQVNNNKLPLQQIDELIANLDNIASETKILFGNRKFNASNVIRILQQYKLRRCFIDGDYRQALLMVKKDNVSWYREPVCLHNIAIACLGIAESGQLNRLNYKEVIGFWLTAVYCDILFIKSLDYTSWDDPYTFTLYDSLGCTKEDADNPLPDNVSFDEPKENVVISIAEVQQALLSRFEKTIENENIYQSFYNLQKDCMDSLRALNMDNPCMIASPFTVCVCDECKSDVISTLDYEYDNYGNENILKVGISYGVKKGIFLKYFKADEQVRECIDSIKDKNKNQVANTFSSEAISSINEFNDLKGSFLSEVYNQFREISQSKSSNSDDVIQLFTPVKNALKDRTFDFMFNRYVDNNINSTLNDIVDKVNGDQMSHHNALKEVYAIYEKYPNNDRVCQNIITLIGMCIMEYIIQDKVGSSAVMSVLNKIKRKKSDVYKRHSRQLLSSREQILNQFPNEMRDLLDPDDRLSPIISLYGGGRVLNEQGQKLKKALDLYKELA